MIPLYDTFFLIDNNIADAMVMALFNTLSSIYLSFDFTDQKGKLPFYLLAPRKV